MKFTNLEYISIISPDRKTTIQRNFSTSKIIVTMQRFDTEDKKIQKFVFIGDKFFFEKLKVPFSSIIELRGLQKVVKISNQKFEEAFDFGALYYSEISVNLKKNLGQSHPLTKTMDKFLEYISNNLYITYETLDYEYSYHYTYTYKYD